MTVVGRHGAPSLSDAAEQLGVPLAGLNSAFGVVPVDPERALYAVEVQSDAIPETPAGRETYRGPFANPPIAPLQNRKKPSDK
jgi:hypothetical protein